MVYNVLDGVVCTTIAFPLALVKMTPKLESDFLLGVPPEQCKENDDDEKSRMRQLLIVKKWKEGNGYDVDGFGVSTVKHSASNYGSDRGGRADADIRARRQSNGCDSPNSYVFVIDMPGLKSEDIKVQVEDHNVLLISGERKRKDDKDGAKYLRMERRVAKFMRKFTLPQNANPDAISALCQDGVLTVTVNKLPPPQPKKPRTIQVQIA
ncbi:hypothetical protein VNO78_00727 [Psophocarpus tetragonolobus]|uniref:SHSP domain-containing protein n=1 Tax=Psophocarpus tetragonolobus TaxID=3891 RepID=A0AAN9SXP7_PSOTE